MSYEVKTHKGKQVWLASGRPATNDAAGFEALTWVRLNGYASGLALGMEGSSVDVEDVASGLNLSGSGLASGKDSEIAYRTIADDDGQALVNTILATCGGAASIKVISAACDAPAVAGDPVKYAQGYLQGGGDNEIAGADPEKGLVNFKQELRTVSAAQPA